MPLGTSPDWVRRKLLFEADSERDLPKRGTLDVQCQTWVGAGLYGDLLVFKPISLRVFPFLCWVFPNLNLNGFMLLSPFLSFFMVIIMETKPNSRGAWCYWPASLLYAHNPFYRGSPGLGILRWPFPDGFQFSCKTLVFGGWVIFLIKKRDLFEIFWSPG